MSALAFSQVVGIANRPDLTSETKPVAVRGRADIFLETRNSYRWDVVDRYVGRECVYDFYLIAASVSYFAQVGIFEVDERVPRLLRYDKRVRWPCVVCVYVEMMKIKEIKICKGGLVV
jgi:hypothetical protein